VVTAPLEERIGPLRERMARSGYRFALGAVACGMIDPTASRTTDQPGGLPVTTSFTLTIDCADADQMMQFWTTALGYKPKDPPEGFDDWCSYFRSIGVPD
jgi:hypothetical protein